MNEPRTFLRLGSFGHLLSWLSWQLILDFESDRSDNITSWWKWFRVFTSFSLFTLTSTIIGLRCNTMRSQYEARAPGGQSITVITTADIKLVAMTALCAIIGVIVASKLSDAMEILRGAVVVGIAEVFELHDPAVLVMLASMVSLVCLMLVMEWMRWGMERLER